MNQQARTQSLQVATLVVLMVIVYLLLSISNRQKVMDATPQGIGQTIGHGATGDTPILTERLEGETLDQWLGRHKLAVEAAGGE